jgi:hypothetical protein
MAYTNVRVIKPGSGIETYVALDTFATSSEIQPSVCHKLQGVTGVREEQQTTTTTTTTGNANQAKTQHALRQMGIVPLKLVRELLRLDGMRRVERLGPRIMVALSRPARISIYNAFPRDAVHDAGERQDAHAPWQRTRARPRGTP